MQIQGVSSTVKAGKKLDIKGSDLKPGTQESSLLEQTPADKTIT